MRWPSAVTRERDADPAASMRLLQEVLDRPLDPGYQSAATRRRAEGLPPSTGQRSLLMLATALAPEIGYDKAAEISKEAYKTGRTIRAVAREETDLSEKELDRLLDARKLTGS